VRVAGPFGAVICSILFVRLGALALSVQPERPTGQLGYASDSLLYVSQASENVVLVYDAYAPDPRPLRQITIGIGNPTGLAVDSSENLYVANLGFAGAAGPSVSEYARGSLIPSFTYTTGLTGPRDVAVDAQGVVYVLNEYGKPANQPGNVVEFLPHLNVPIRTLSYSGFDDLLGLTIDGRRNVFVSSEGSVIRFPRGSGPGADMGLKDISDPGGIKFDNAGGLVVANPRSPGQIDVFRPGRLRPVHVFGRTGYPAALGFNQARNVLYVGDTVNVEVEAYAYPSGALLANIGKGYAYADGIALSPPPPY
jgi:hypothetical protein